MKYYVITTRHGRYELYTGGGKIAGAIKCFCDIFLCPESAIIKIEELVK